MHNRDKYPEIWAAKEKAEVELAELMTARKVEADKMVAVQLKIDTLKKTKTVINAEAMKDADRIAELRGEISRMARAMGAVVASGG